MPIDHTSLPVPFSKVDDEVNFITAALGHMGIKEMMRPHSGVVGIGDDAPWLWVGGVDCTGQPIPDDAKIYRTHLAVTAKSAFH